MADAPDTGPTRVLVLGTGALACLYGARLARFADTDVTLAGTWAAALRAIATSGITVESNGDCWSVWIPAVERAAATGPADLVLVLVKSHQTEAVAEIAARVVAPGGLILSLQNGLGNHELLARSAGAACAAVGVTSMGAALVGPGRVRAGGPGLTVLGAGPETRARVERAARLLGAVGETQVTDDLDRLVWRKLAVSCAINPLTALKGVTNGALLEDIEAKARMAAAAREVEAVAAALGIDLGADPLALAVDVARRTAGNRSSMLQDVARGAPTEIDAINGAVVRAGRRLGVPTPVNDELWRAVRALGDGLPMGEGLPAPVAAAVRRSACR